MPIVKSSEYSAALFFRNAHAQTVYPSVFRKVDGIFYSRERIHTPDDDFIDVDWSRVGARRLTIALHGLEGDSGRSYMRGMARAINRRGWDAMCLNFRGCSGEPNRQARMYHSGETGDLSLVISRVLADDQYDDLNLVGFSLGGNVVLKYLGERGSGIDKRIRGAVAISVPCDLGSCSIRLQELGNWAYSRRFLKMLRRKLTEKKTLYPDVMDISTLDSVKTLSEFDDRFTAPLHGFRDARDYYQRSSSKQFLGGINIPCLLLNAADDPFLTPECFPHDEARSSSSLYLETPRHGGHVGFVSFDANGEYWSETRATQFLAETC